MKCEKCGLLLSVKDHLDAPDGKVLRFTCNNPQCPNYHTIVAEITIENVEIATPGDEE